MAIKKADSHIDVYRIRALSGNVKSLSGRASTNQTDTINEFILSKSPQIPGATVVDIGCGDGSLLNEFLAKSKIGIVPTLEEKVLLDKYWKGRIDIQLGQAQGTALPDNCADIVILSGVLILLDENSVPEALKEVRRIAKQGAWIYIGDVPEIDEGQKVDYGNSILAYLIHLYRNQGVSRLVGELIKLISSLIGLDNYVIKPKTLFHVQPDYFVGLCKKIGFCVASYGKQVEWDNLLESPVESPTRWFYILNLGNI
jgi:ubiquinone/menaquinone biosynthesis C-methylase UbiE